MKAAIIAVGSELLGPSRIDTNSLGLTAVLERNGVKLLRKSVVGDDRDEIAGELDGCLKTCDVVIVTGGLGPTEDDVTRDAVAKACGLSLVRDEEVLRDLREKFSSRGMRMPSVNERQAMVFRGHRLLPNRRGTAPGFHLNIVRENDERHIWVFPGVPWELEAMVDADFEPWLRKVHPDRGAFRRVIKVTGMTESAVDEKLAPFHRKHSDSPITVLATSYEIQLHLRAEGTADEAYATLTSLENELRELLGERVYGVDQDLLESVVGRMLASRGETVATAESCTGGLLGSRITDVSGSSAYFMGGVVTYSRQAKLFLLGVDPAVIESHGEVSEAVAKQMAEGARRRFSTRWGIGITGIAGPTGGTQEKPVGTVHVAVAEKDRVVHRHVCLPPPRERVKHLSVQLALDTLRRMMLEEGEEHP